jgi:hypothetical protein
MADLKSGAIWLCALVVGGAVHLGRAPIFVAAQAEVSFVRAAGSFFIGDGAYNPNIVEFGTRRARLSGELSELLTSLVWQKYNGASRESISGGVANGVDVVQQTWREYPHAWTVSQKAVKICRSRETDGWVGIIVPGPWSVAEKHEGHYVNNDSGAGSVVYQVELKFEQRIQLRIKSISVVREFAHEHEWPVCGMRYFASLFQDLRLSSIHRPLSEIDGSDNASDNESSDSRQALSDRHPIWFGIGVVLFALVGACGGMALGYLGTNLSCAGRRWNGRLILGIGATWFLIGAFDIPIAWVFGLIN